MRQTLNKSNFLKKIILLYYLLSLTFFGFAQKQANIWYFGNKVGLDFNQSPPGPLYNATIIADEGCATISDQNGAVLFYTNGLVIINRKHMPMKNGTGLMGGLSSSDNTLIVPIPGDDSIYYVFTVGAAFQENNGFRYNVIDMKGDGGFGEVIDKNLLLQPAAFEKLAAVRHCNKKDTWVVIHKWDSDEYHAYLVTASGVSATPVISHTNLFITGHENNTVGKLKFSIDGKRLVAAHNYENDLIELMNFDNATGLITNPVYFRPTPVGTLNQYTGAYAAEFSPNGRLLYVSDNFTSDTTNALYQFDISSGDPATIVASRQTIANPFPFFSAALQTGPDLKIYIAMAGSNAVSVISNPDQYGTGCNFLSNEIFLGLNDIHAVKYGLPNFIASYFDPLSNPFDFTRSGNCTDHSISFKINRLSGIDSVKWSFGDGQQSQVLQPTHTYAAPGFYDVNLIVYKIDCSGLNDTINHKIWITDLDKFLGADTSSCNPLALEIGVDEISGVNYLWNTGLHNSKITTTGFGDYWLEMEQNGCKVRDTISVFAKPKPTVSLGKDTTICRFKPVILRTSTSDYDSYSWSTGETSASIPVNQGGTYYVTVTKNACEASDTVLVSTGGDCDVYIPSAFTPNNDNINDAFGVIDNVAVQYFSLQIYNKWGQLVFNSNDIFQKWDGTFKGKKMPNGSYVWMLTYVNRKGRKFYEQGTVMLIR